MEDIKFDEIKKLIPKRKPKSHKGTYGTMLSICGSSMYRGAAVLSSESALRCGVGILRLAGVEEVCYAVSARLPEVTFLPQREGENGEIVGFCAQSVFEKYSGITSVLCGCGLTVTTSTKRVVCDIVENAPCQIVLDADALNCISREPEILRKSARPVIITPHWGEFARLNKCGVEELEGSAESIAENFAREFNCILVLKSYYTLIAAPNGKVRCSRAGNAGLARGGSGDVLAGMIASFAAQGLSATDAAKLGVALHGSAADRCAARLGMSAMLPHDILKDMADILHESEETK